MTQGNIVKFKLTRIRFEDQLVIYKRHGLMMLCKISTRVFYVASKGCDILQEVPTKSEGETIGLYTSSFLVIIFTSFFLLFPYFGLTATVSQNREERRRIRVNDFYFPKHSSVIFEVI